MPIKTGIIDPDLALRIVRESKVMAYDTETTGLQAGKDRVVGYVFTDFYNSVYIPVRHTGGGNIANGEQFEADLRVAFAERHRLGYRTVGHHLGFDLRMSLWEGIVILGPLEDTMINESLIDDRTRGYGLDDCSARHQVTVKKGAELYAAIAARFGGVPDRKRMEHFHRMPGDQFEVVDYTTGDGVSTIELWESQQRILDEENLRVPWQLECDLLPYVARAHHRGIHVDADYAAQLGGENGILTAQINGAKQKFTPGFNVRSPKEVEGLYRLNGYTDDMFDRTDKGAVSFTEKWLETNEIGDAILSVRRLEKARDSFITPLTDTYNIGGKIHAVLHQSKSDEYGVAGSRFSCSDPNLQAFPKRNKMVGKLVRPLIIPKPGMVLEEADAWQQEPRLFTHYSQEPALLEGYRSGTMDMHDRANEILFGNKDRDKAKRLGLGMLTMMSVPTLAGHMRSSVAEARAWHHGFLDDAFPHIKEFQQQVIRVFKQRGFVKSILGRRARLESPRFAYQGVSRVIQNSAGDHLKTCMLRAFQFEDAYAHLIEILLSIHDSLIWQRDPGALGQVKELVRIIENVPHEPQFNLSVPIPFEVGSGKHWGEASYGEKLKERLTWRI